MSESVSNQDFAARLAADFVAQLREMHPGVVEEWERQREAALADGEPEDNWPSIDNLEGVRWWLRSEAAIADDYAKHAGDESDIYRRETEIRDYCLGAADILRAMLEDGDSAYDGGQ